MLFSSVKSVEYRCAGRRRLPAVNAAVEMRGKEKKGGGGELTRKARTSRWERKEMNVGDGGEKRDVVGLLS